MAKSWSDRFLSYPPEKRRKIKLTEKGLPKTEAFKRHKSYTKEEVIEYVKRNNITSQYKFEGVTEFDLEAPTMYMVRKYFGKWSVLKKIVWGEAEKFRPTDEQIVNLIISYRIRTKKQYESYRKKEKFIFPPITDLLKRFGSWNNVKRLAMSKFIPSIVERFYLLKKKIEKWPTKQICRDNGVEIDELFKEISYKDFQELIETLEERDNER